MESYICRSVKTEPATAAPTDPRLPLAQLLRRLQRVMHGLPGCARPRGARRSGGGRKALAARAARRLAGPIRGAVAAYPKTKPEIAV
jgi:hypothetical protein